MSHKKRKCTLPRLPFYTKRQKCNPHELPLYDDVLHNIFCQLSAPDIIIMRYVSKDFLKVTKEDVLWKSIHMKFFGNKYELNIHFETLVLHNKMILEKKTEIDKCLWAIQNHYNELLKRLLTSNEMITLCAREVRPLNAAIQYCNNEAINILFAHECKIESDNGWNPSPLYSASEHGNIDVCKKLIQRGVNIESIYGERTPICMAVTKGHLDIVKYLYNNGGNLNVRIDRNVTPLYLAAEKNMIDCLSFILSESTSNLEIKYAGIFTPIYIAARNGHTNCVCVLINAGADINVITEGHGTPLYIASENGHAATVELLLKRGADIILSHLNGFSSLHMASQNGHHEVIESLCEHYSSNINEYLQNGCTPLYMATSNGHSKSVETLLKYGASQHIKYDGTTCLFRACYTRYTDIIKLLLNNNVSEINTATPKGSTPLGITITHKDIEMVKYLCQRGADINQLHRERGPLELAIECGSDEIVQYLRELGALESNPI